MPKRAPRSIFTKSSGDNYLEIYVPDSTRHESELQDFSLMEMRQG